MPDEQNLASNNNGQPQNLPASSWSPETAQNNLPTQAPSNQNLSQVPVEAPQNDQKVSQVPVEPVAVKPPVLKDPQEEEVLFRPQPIEEIKEQPSAALTSKKEEKKEGLTFTELATKYYKGKEEMGEGVNSKDVSATPSSSGQNASQNFVQSLNTDVSSSETNTSESEKPNNLTSEATAQNQTNSPETQNADAPNVSKNSPQLHESGHFTSLPGGEDIDTTAEEEIFKNIQPSQPFQNTSENNSINGNSESEQQNRENSIAIANPESFNAEDPHKNKTKKIILAVLIPLILIGLGVGGYFGWVWLDRLNTIKILNASAQNLNKGEPMQIDYKATFNGFSSEGKLSFDADGDLKVLTNLGAVPLDLSYIKSEDKLYFAGPDNQYMVYTNVASSVNDLTKESPNLDKELQKNNMDLIKNIKKLKSEEITGIKTKHYLFEAPPKLLEEIVNNNENIRTSGIKISKLTMEIWVGAKDNKAYKIKINGVYNISESMQNQAMGISLDKMDISLELNFAYGSKENIAAPQNPNIVTTTDLKKSIDPTNPNTLVPSI